jgi:hypothetical protein
LISSSITALIDVSFVKVTPEQVFTGSLQAHAALDAVIGACNAVRDEFETRTGHADSIPKMQRDDCQENTRAGLGKT